MFGVAPDWWSLGFHPQLPLGSYAATDVEETLVAAGFVESEVVEAGAAAFLRQLVKGDMSSEYENEIRLLIEELKELEEIDGEPETL